MKFVLRDGLSVPLEGAPVQDIETGTHAVPFALLGGDYPAVRIEVLVAEGDPVRPGTVVFRDRNRSDIVFVSPLAGTVSEIAIGARRRLSMLSVAPRDDEPVRFDTSGADTAEGLRALLLSAGQWPAFRQRPFERVPAPGTAPKAIFVTATDTDPHAPDPLVVLDGRHDAFERGVNALALLTEGPVYVCQPDGEPLIKPGARILAARFVGAHPAGLPGTHIARLAPVRGGEPVWHIGYQDVIAIGHLLGTGEIDGHRVIALSGPGMRNPRLVRVPLGADLHHLARPEISAGAKTILSGSVLGGRESRYLGRYHRQATVLERARAPRQHWLVAALRRVETIPPFIPTQALERAVGTDTPVVPLLRALSIGDAQSAERLGCVQLAEDDLALASYAAGGALDFGQKLRAVLDELEEGA